MKKTQKSVDVCINVYGKPWQTLCTLKSLIKHSGYHIDKIYLIKERIQPYHANIDFIFKYFHNLIIFTPVRHDFWSEETDLIDEKQRHTIRYQYGIEKSDKKYIFLTHNDVLYTGDVLSEMLSKAEGMIGVGHIGQCWNCPASHVGVCSGERFYEWQPTYDEVTSLPLPFSRTTKDLIDTKFPKPLPECRLNEWACLLNREMLIKEQDYQDRNSIFGLANKIDIGCSWFKSMTIKGYQFFHYNQQFDHGYWAKNSGHATLLDKALYLASEKVAKKYFYAHFSTASRWIKFLTG
ncbi:hypothetical protein [Polynucleobacter paneuropaeus]|uniref:hypothetical protein n=1 Tax=Polynucleobacter paneuropaeus TaxID=2527775 RepID=UPI000DBF0E3A|nr:hypothetical protein [Polynucleobacter paneuropaeus]AWW44130.1 hypothetical protein DPM16_02125 [Polynucleobacter paneuropaeus]AWW47545.1 hypothetical protein DPM17_02105 [Polynucleobacter paneuropaeus]